MNADAVSEGEAQSPPLLRVVRGTPTPQELAALVAVVAARRAEAPELASASEARSDWGHPARSVRAPLHPAVDGWRRSGLPR